MPTSQLTLCAYTQAHTTQTQHQHPEVLKAFAEATTSPILAVSGNVDDTPSASQLLPPHRVVDVAGWRLLLVHIVASAATSKGGLKKVLTI